MTAPRWYSTPEPEEDYLFPPAEPTLKVKARCRCGVRGVGNFKIAQAFLRKWLSGERIAPDDIAGSSWCRDCKRLVKVFARDLHLA